MQNPGFDVNTDHWTADPNTVVTRSASDGAGNGQSGALDVAVTGADPGIVLKVAASQCVPVTAGATYDVGVQIRVVGLNASQGGLNLWYYPTPSCSGSASGSVSLPLSATLSSWVTVSDAATIPSGVQSALVRLVALKPYARLAAEAMFDNVIVKRR